MKILLILLILSANVFSEEESIKYITLEPEDDTYATYDDKTVHGAEPIIKVGIEPKACQPDGNYNPCKDKGEVCCVADDSYNYCAPSEDQCGSGEKKWYDFRKYRGYIRFNLSTVPKGKVLEAHLNLRLNKKVENLGGTVKIVVTRLKQIGDNVCKWQEETLNDTNLTTWSALPQNLTVKEGDVWSFEVTKAVKDWLNGDTDYPDNPVQPNCGFHLYDPDFGKPDAPISRWVIFSSKEGDAAPKLTIKLALDLDGDGYYADTDCDESNPEIHPGATEICDGIDNNCDGLIDNEKCDGIDNDCDGEVDEGTDLSLCGEGQKCVNHQCLKVCEDECAGAFDLKCEKDENGVFKVYNCKNIDDDPCLEWNYVKDCVDPQPYCEFGFCSSNCVDLCDTEGEKGCVKDKFDNWAIGTCGDFDNDGCREWGNLQYCNKGASCENATCIGGCTDECSPIGASKCVDVDGGGSNAVSVCYYHDSKCLTWSTPVKCDSGVCENGACLIDSGNIQTEKTEKVEELLEVEVMENEEVAEESEVVEVVDTAEPYPDFYDTVDMSGAETKDGFFDVEKEKTEENGQFQDSEETADSVSKEISFSDNVSGDGAFFESKDQFQIFQAEVENEKSQGSSCSCNLSGDIELSFYEFFLIAFFGLFILVLRRKSNSERI